MVMICLKKPQENLSNNKKFQQSSFFDIHHKLVKSFSSTRQCELTFRMDSKMRTVWFDGRKKNFLPLPEKS
jgi:hypothetical protein